MAFCSNCGNEIPDGVRFCSNCGASINPYVDPTRAYAITPQPEPELKGIDKFGKFFWIPLLILAIVDFMSDPPILTLILAIAVIGGAIFALSRKYKMKGFIIIALIMSAICILTGVSQGKKYGWFRIPDKSEYTSSADKDGESGSSTSASESKPADTSESESVTSEKPNTITNSEKETTETAKEPSESAKDTSEPAKETGDTSASVKTGGVDPELKAFLDSYEAYVDEYVDFMKKYMANPTDLSLLGEYTDMMDKLADFETTLDKYDSNDMSTEDAAYYLEVTTRCTQKMLEVL
ncbi:MAG: zinc-ribbon domain-containing protein [Lachnospiraceae bacterium]|nr:zinc-ribbon domain-containing protein [Lachnospiraceae bacterium]